MTTTIPTSLPAGTVETLRDWEVNRDQRVTRTCIGPQRGIDAMEVQLLVEQEYGGDILHRTALVCVKGGGIVDVDASSLRQFAADALAVADELDEPHQ